LSDELKIVLVSSITAIIIMVGGGLFNVWIQKRKNKSEYTSSVAQASNSLAEAAKTMVEPLRAQVESQALQILQLRSDMSKLKDMIRDWFSGIILLSGQIQRLGAEPIWRPELNDDVTDVLKGNN